MKFILVFSICSGITGFCGNPLKVETPYNSWAECVIGGSQLIMDYAIDHKEKFNNEKLMVSYFCNENHINKTPT